MAPVAAAAAAAAVVATILARFAGAATPGSLKAAAAAFANACELMLTTDAPVAGWLRGAPVAARAADRRLAAARGRNNSRVLALARLVLLLREARAVRRRHVLLQWPPTMRPHRHRQIQPRRPRRPRLRGCGHPDRRQPLAQPADLSYREQRLCTTCRMALLLVKPRYAFFTGCPGRSLGHNVQGTGSLGSLRRGIWLPERFGTLLGA